MSANIKQCVILSFSLCSRRKKERAREREAREGDTRVSLSRARSFLRPLFPSAYYAGCLSFIYAHEIVFQMFKGNYDRYIVVQHKFARPLYGRYFRVYPVSWYSYIGMRVEFYGCVYGKRYHLLVRLYKKCQLLS